MGIIFALLTTLSWSIGIFPFTEAARRLGSNSLNHFRLLIAVVFLFTASVIINPLLFFNIFSLAYKNEWFWFGLSGIVGLALGDYFFFDMYAILGARLGSIFTTLSPAAALVTSKFFIDEKINGIGVFGIFLTITSVAVIGLSKKETSHTAVLKFGSVLRGSIFGVLAAFCQGIGLVFAKKGFMTAEQNELFVSPITATFMRMIVSFIALSTLTLLLQKHIEVIAPVKQNRQGGIKYAFAGALFGPCIGVSLSLYTITLIEATVAQTIFSLVPLVAAFIAVIFYNEKLRLLSVGATMVAVAGVLILIWRNELQQYLISFL